MVAAPDPVVAHSDNSDILDISAIIRPRAPGTAMTARGDVTNDYAQYASLMLTEN